MPERSYSHQVAVNAYLLKKGKFLLLKRTTPPLIWSPPGGRLHQDEDPVQGLLREIAEETQWEAEVIAPVNTWFGKWQNRRLLAIDYLVLFRRGNLKLSEEHSAGLWVCLEELRKGKPIRLRAGAGFQLTDFEKAWELYENHKKVTKS
jgi:ADP-ribose pyrophosphatase YjhB (NUDIX family)